MSYGKQEVEAVRVNAGGTCLRCGAPYEPDDTVCYTCGAPIGETEGDTAPVKIVRTNRQAAVEHAESLDAASAAADASLSPQGVGVGAGPVPPGQAVRTPPEVDPARITVGSSAARRPTAGEAGLATTTTAAPGRGRRGRRVWLVVVIAAALVLAAAGGALYARHGTTTTPPPVAQQATYSDPTGRFHFLRPALWSATPTADGVSLTDSGGTSSVTVAVVTPGASGVPAGATAAAYADQLARQQGGAKPLDPLPARQIAGTTWQQREGQVTGPDGAVRETLLLVTLHGGELYAITCTSPVANFGATQNLVFDPLLGSFAFGA
ncbi:MAG TPA: hypothetical protein VF116_11585 [Ktedonobacterales bacterium]